MGQESKEPCKRQACDIQSCLSKSNFNPQRCIDVIQKLQKCCEMCNYDSTHCASVAGLLKQYAKPPPPNNNIKSNSKSSN